MLARREFLQSSAGAVWSAATAAAVSGIALPSASQSKAAEEPTAQPAPGNAPPLIVDTHQHLWNLKRQKLPWLATAPEVLRQTYDLPEYAQATQGLKVRAVYMEVDVAAEQLTDEAQHVLDICRGGQAPTTGAVIGGRPHEAGFEKYVERFSQSPALKGVRRVLHGAETPAGFCLQESFVQGVQLLGSKGLKFDLCLRPTDLADGLQLSERCPDTQLVLDHCGNADPKAWDARLAGSAQSDHAVDSWKRGIERLAKRPNVLCKISGIVARLPAGGDAGHLAPIVNFCLDQFGPDRVIFGSDWPVCLLGRPLKVWVALLDEIVRTRPAADQQKLWSGNALVHYRLKN